LAALVRCGSRRPCPCGFTWRHTGPCQPETRFLTLSYGLADRSTGNGRCLAAAEAAPGVSPLPCWLQILRCSGPKDSLPRRGLQQREPSSAWLWAERGAQKAENSLLSRELQGISPRDRFAPDWLHRQPVLLGLTYPAFGTTPRESRRSLRALARPHGL
jgi:hypothetical protein